MSSITREYFSTGFKRWLRWIALAVVFAVACGFLANWQWNRRVQVLTVINRIDRNWDHSMQPLETLVPRPSAFALKHEYLPVLVSGKYLAEKAVLLRNQVNNGSPGFDQLVPFQLDSGRVILIDRGWVSVGNSQNLPDSLPEIPAGRVTAVGRLIHMQQADSRTAPQGQAMSINTSQLNHRWKFDTADLYVGAFLRLAVEHPKPKAYPVLASKPDITEGNHLSYAFQWVLFAVLAFVAIFANIRKDLQELRAERDPNFVPKPPRRKRQTDIDAETEDALLTERD